jgi:putative endonuclease
LICQAGDREFKSRRSRHFQIGLVIFKKVTGLFFAMACFVYILKSLKDSSYYVGSANDLVDRLKRHNEGRVSYTKSKRPWRLVFHEEHPDRSSAMKKENAIKSRKSKAYIESLIKSLQNQA